jgi:hypothetical protein
MSTPLDNYKERVRVLYLEENKPLKVVMDEMYRSYGVTAR